MSAGYLVPVLTGLSLTAVTYLSARSHRLQSGSENTYTYPAPIGYVIVFVALLFFAVPFLPGAVGDADPLLFFGLFWWFSATAIGMAVYLFLYRVTVGPDKIVVSVLRKAEFNVSDIVEVKEQKGARSRQLFVTFAGGRRVAFSGLLGDFGLLAAELSSHADRPKA